MRKQLREKAAAAEWPLGFVLFCSGFAVFLASPMEKITSIDGAIIAAIGILIAVDAVQREGTLA